MNPIHRAGARYASSAAFELSENDKKRAATVPPYLSVNSTELLKAGDIAAFYASKEPGATDVAFCIHKVSRYVSEGKKAGGTLRRGQAGHEFQSSKGWEAAFSHEPVKPLNLSHCGVHLVRGLSDIQQKKFAIGMASNPRYQVLPVKK